MNSRNSKIALSLVILAALGGFIWFAASTDSDQFEGETRKPNIIVILTDDQTFESLDKMPYLASREDWVFFDNAYWNVALCCPSRATLFTGQYDTHTGVITNKPKWGYSVFNNSETLAVWLDRVGYRTALFGKYMNGYKALPMDPPPGWDKWFAFIGEADYYGYKINNDGTRTKYKGKSQNDYSTDVLAHEAVQFIRDSGDQPFFIYWSPKTPHTPFLAAKRHIGHYAQEPMPDNPNINEPDVSDKPEYIRAKPPVPLEIENAYRRNQWDMLLAVDEAIEKFETVLREEGKAGNTVIMFLSDNGYTFGEHRLTGKRCAYDACMRAAFAVRFPGASGGHLSQLVSNIDIAPTIAELAGAEIPISVDGVSLVPLLKGETPSWRDSLLGHWGGADTVKPLMPNFWSVRTGDYRYTEYVTGEKELYDYTADPYELANKADDPSYGEIQNDLKLKLDVLVEQAEAPSKGPDGKSKPAAEDLTPAKGRVPRDDDADF